MDELPPEKHAYDMVWVDEWRGDRVRSRLCVRQFKAEGLWDDLFAGTPDTFFIKYLLAQAASCKEFGLFVVDISVAFMHARTDEGIYVKVTSGIKSSRFWRIKAAVNGTRKASKHWQEYSPDKQTDRHFSNESGSLESQYEELLKSALRLWRSNAHNARAALCGAVLALSGTGTMVSVTPRPVPWHQRLDNRRSPLCASQLKKQKKTFIGVDIYLITFFAESQYHSTKRSDPDAESGKNDVQSVHRSSFVTIRESTRHRDRDTAV